eukprot:4202466-Alexandrium_andersonii.AAC.1
MPAAFSDRPAPAGSAAKARRTGPQGGDPQWWGCHSLYALRTSRAMARACLLYTSDAADDM